MHIGNQNEMIDQSCDDAEIPPRCRDGIERMLWRLIKEQSAPDTEIKEFDDGSPSPVEKQESWSKTLFMIIRHWVYKCHELAGKTTWGSPQIVGILKKCIKH